MGEAQTVLVVEDEAHISDLVCLHLGLEGFSCVTASDGQSALSLTEARAFELIVLDLMIPRLDGVTVCRAVRRGTLNRDTPILMLTAKREEADKVLGLESGADDYLTKPFGVRELVARVRALLRRGSKPLGGPPTAPAAGGEPETSKDRSVSIHGVEIDPARRRVAVRGEVVALTEHEFRLLYTLAASPGFVFSREALLHKVWQGDTFVTTRSVDTLVKRLRRKIEPDSADPHLILTIWGVGYKFADA
jgi:DNA-binding response OmpR family regulator